MPGQPRREPLCPICGQPNDCHPARTGAFDGPCWCEGETFSARVLALVPHDRRNMACICQKCARAGS